MSEVTVEIVDSSSVVVENAIGLRGPKGDTGATGVQGPSGVITVTAPITNSGTSTSAALGFDATGFVKTSDTATVTNTMLAGSIANAKLANSSVTVNGTSVALGTSATVTAQPYFQFPFRSNYWVTTPGFGNSTQIGVINYIYYTPFIVPVTTSFKAIGVYITTGQASTTARLGVYNADANGVPTTLVFDAGTVSTVTSASAPSITISQTLNPGNYCLAYVSQGGTTQPSVYTPTTLYALMPSTDNRYTQITHYVQTGVSGTLPSTATPTPAYVAPWVSPRLQVA